MGRALATRTPRSSSCRARASSRISPGSSRSWGLTGDGARTLFDLTHILPADAALLDELQSQPDEYFGGQKTFELWGEIARDAPKVFFGKGFTEAQAILGNHLQQILSGEKSAEDGMHEAAEEMRAKLKKS